MGKEIICITCPRGCHIQVEGEGENITSITGNGCRRGIAYATAEFTRPVRILTTTVKLAGKNDTLLPVRSSKPLPKDELMSCMDIIRNIEVPIPVQQYDVIVPDILGTGADIIASSSIENP